MVVKMEVKVKAMMEMKVKMEMQMKVMVRMVMAMVVVMTAVGRRQTKRHSCQVFLKAP